MKDSESIRALISQAAVQLDLIHQTSDEVIRLSEQRSLLNDELIKSVISQLMELKQFQDCLKSEYSELFPEESVPESISSIEEKIDEYELFLKNKKEFDEVGKVIERFAHITSDIEECRKMLKDFSDKARTVERDKLSIDEYKVALAPYAQFCDLVETCDKSVLAEKAQTIFSFFGSELICQLMFGKFHFFDDNAADYEKAEVIDEESPVIYEEVAAVQDNEGSASDNAESEDTEELDTSGSLEIPFTVGKITGYGDVVITSKKATVPVDYKDFKRLLRSDVNRFFFLFCGRSIKLTSSSNDDQESGNDFHSAAKALVEAGFIDAASTEDSPAVYHINKRGYKALKKSSYQFNGSMINYVDLDADNSYADMTVNVYFSELWSSMFYETYMAVTHRLSEVVDGFKTESEFFLNGRDFIVETESIVMNDSVKLRNLRVSAFIEDDNSAERYIDALKNVFSKSDVPIDIVYLTAYTSEDCKKHLDFIRSLTSLTDGSVIVKCSPHDGKCYYDGEEVSDEQLLELLVKKYEDVLGVSLNEADDDFTETDIITADYSEVGEIVYSTNDAKISTRTFKKDMKRMDFALIISLISQNEDINVRYFKNYYAVMDKNHLIQKIDGTVFDSMCDLGYLDRYIMGDNEPYYCASVPLTKVMDKQTVSWLQSHYSIKFSPMTAAKGSETVYPGAPFFANRLLSAIIKLNTRNLLFSKGLHWKKRVNRTYSYYSLYAVETVNHSSVNADILIICACLPENKEIIEFTHSISSILKNGKAYDILIIGGYTFDECVSYAKYLHSRDQGLENTFTLYYALDADCVYEQNGSQISSDEISDILSDVIFKDKNEDENSIETEKNTEKYSSDEDIERVEGKILASEEAVPAIAVIGDSSEEEENFVEEEKKNETSSYEVVSAPKQTEESVGFEDAREYTSTAVTEFIDLPGMSYKLNLTEEQITDTVFELLIKRQYAYASAYLRAVSKLDRNSLRLYNELAFAMNDPAVSCSYTSSVVSGVFDSGAVNSTAFDEILKICAVLRTLFLIDQHDYQYKALYASVQGSSYLTYYNKTAADLMFRLADFKDSTGGIGVDAYADYRIADTRAITSIVETCSANAREHFEYYFNTPVTERKAMPRFLDTKKMILKKNDYLYDCLRIVAEDNRGDDELEYIRDFLAINFIDNSSEIKSSNISKKMIDKYIDHYWAEAGKQQREKHKSSKLVDSLRMNLYQMLMKLLTDISNWYYYVTALSGAEMTNEHTSEKSDILSVTEDAIQICDEILSSGNTDKSVLAGNACVRAVLDELRERLKGEYLDNGNRYYYSDFLYYGEVMLDSSFLPIIETELSEIDGFSPIDRILRHSRMIERDIDERVDEIFNRVNYDPNLSDDYGCAELIKEYCSNVLEREWNDDINNIEANRNDAVKQMKHIKSKFIGTLELDQSYGKIGVDVKDMLLAIIDNQYERAMADYNFGFFKRMLNYCKQTVNNKALKRGEEVRVMLSNAETEYSDLQEAEKMFRTAEQMMSLQNYTVVEDLINRVQQRDYSDDTVIDQKDYLEEFIRSYEDIFKLVYNNPRIAMLKAKIEKYNSGNRHGEIALNIISNFFDVNKLPSLLTALGFNIDNCVPAVDKRNCFDITLKKPMNGKRDNYLHPIYAFGSYALDNGFRVLYLAGKNDYSNILDAIKGIGTSKNTILIVNWALELHDRRELARKIKAQMPDDKITLVVDRVAMYYLADRNEESTSSVNRILMQICAPFASFQPYTEDAAKAIPSEMFMGRTKLLREIESAKGANVICGGRQLGKSALLRMAKTDINYDGDGNRAVYVDIKTLDHKKAALKVSQILIDEQILDEQCITDKWYELARFIGLRLRDTKKKSIPYFLLLIDEADALFESSKADDYTPIRALEDLQTEGNEKFKFVFAGLRNLVKFERELATNKNSSLPHITVKTIRPFSVQEARELLEVPLHYLGIRFPKDKEYLISLILASTNYFPGLIHQYCAYLIKALQEKDYADYTVDKTPPYELTETQIKKILSDENFTREIKRKFEITLKLDMDNYYDIIATLVAYCSYNGYSSNGFTPGEIMQVAKEYEINKLMSQGIEKLSALMDELCELNILRKNSENRYLFARYNFIQMIGKDKGEIDEKLLQYLGV